MGIFDMDNGIDFGDIEEVRFENVPAGIYGAMVSSIEDSVNKKGQKQVVIDYTITDSPEEKWLGKSVREYKTYTIPSDPDFDPKGLGYIKSRFIDLGVPKDYKGTVDPENLFGTEVVITLKQNKEYVNVSRVEKVGSTSVSTPTQVADSTSAHTPDDDNPFA